MECNGTEQTAYSSAMEKLPLNALIVSKMVRNEVHKILKELSITDEFIRKEQIDEIIEKCLKKKVAILQDDDLLKVTTSESDMNQELEVTFEMNNEPINQKILLENFHILEQRITTLEDRICAVLESVPELNKTQSKKFEINIDAIRDELLLLMNGMEGNQKADRLQGLNLKHFTSPITASIPIRAKKPPRRRDSKSVPRDAGGTSTNKRLSSYDEMYYEQRQNAINLLQYKKSLTTLKLNCRPTLNYPAKPVNREVMNVLLSHRRKKSVFVNNSPAAKQ